MTTVEIEPRERADPCCGLGESPVAVAEAERLAGMFKALGDPARLRMVSIIAAKPEVCVCEITPAFDLSSGTVSHHLRTLREAGLVDCERRGTYVYYWIQRAPLETLSALLSDPVTDRGAGDLMMPSGAACREETTPPEQPDTLVRPGHLSELTDVGPVTSG